MIQKFPLIIYLEEVGAVVPTLISGGVGIRTRVASLLTIKL